LRQIPSDAFEMLFLLRKPLPPSLGEFLKLALVVALKRARVRRGTIDALVEITNKSILEMIGGQLLEQHPREPNRQPLACVLQSRRTDQIQQRQIRLRRRLIQPRLAMRVRAVVEDVGQVSVQNNAQRADGLAHGGPMV